MSPTRTARRSCTAKLEIGTSVSSLIWPEHMAVAARAAVQQCGTIQQVAAELGVSRGPGCHFLMPSRLS